MKGHTRASTGRKYRDTSFKVLICDIIRFRASFASKSFEQAVIKKTWTALYNGVGTMSLTIKSMFYGRVIFQEDNCETEAFLENYTEIYRRTEGEGEEKARERIYVPLSASNLSLNYWIRIDKDSDNTQKEGGIYRRYGHEVRLVKQNMNS